LNEIKHIGIFDSGIGGLSVANLIYNAFPACSITYLADNAFFPFGERNERSIYDRLVKGIEILQGYGCADIIIACNTASIVYDKHQIPTDSNIITITQSVIDAIRNDNEASEFHVLATKYTIKSYYYQQEIEKLHSAIPSFGHALPDWVNFVENEMGIAPAPKLQLDLFPATNSTLVLACTHFSFVKQNWQNRLDPSIRIIDSSNALVNSLTDDVYAGKGHTEGAYRLIFTDVQKPHVELTPDIPWLCTPLPFGEIV
jgi:glutamate racemase